MASGAHEFAPPAFHETVASQVSDRPGDVTAMWVDPASSRPASEVTVETVAGMRGINLISALSQMAPTEIAKAVARYPKQIDALLASPPAARQVSELWEGLSADSKAALIEEAPRLVGNLDGFPLRYRGQANLAQLGSTMSKVTGQLAEATSQASKDALGKQLALLTQIDTAVHENGTGPGRSLVLFDPSGGGRAAIALGDPDTADYVSYLVPGMNYNVHDQIVNWSATAEALYAEQRAVLKTIRAKKPARERETVATIAWIGYEAPDLFSVGGLDRAELGADYLEESWRGLLASRGSDQPFLSVFAHSYGSTVTLTALSRSTVTLDALVLVGSPGSAVQSAGDLRVANNQVYVGEADWDPAVNSAFFGSDPGGESYGARSLGVTGARDRLTGAKLDGSIGHNEYFKPGSESLHNMALIGTGNAKLVTNGSE